MVQRPCVELYLRVLIFLLLQSCYFRRHVYVYAFVNVTVERDDTTSIIYAPKHQWREAWPGVRVSDAEGATATFNFSGISVYYQSWLWTYPTFITVQLDNRPAVSIDLTDHSYNGPKDVIVPTNSTIIAVGLGLTNSSHVLTLSHSSTQRLVIVGKFLYTTDHPPPSPARTTTLPSPSATSTPPHTSNKNRVLKIVLPSALSALLLLALTAIWVFKFPQYCCIPIRRQSEEKRDRSLPLHQQHDMDHHFDPNVIPVMPADKADYTRWQID